MARGGSADCWPTMQGVVASGDGLNDEPMPMQRSTQPPPPNSDAALTWKTSCSGPSQRMDTEPLSLGCSRRREQRMSRCEGQHGRQQ